MTKAKKKTILIAASHTGAANSLAPVIKRLRREGRINTLVVAHGSAVKVFNDNSVAFTDIGEQSISLEYASLVLRTAESDLALVGTSAKEERGREIIEHSLTAVAKADGIKSLAVVDFWGSYGPNSIVRFGDRFTGEAFKFVPDKIAVLDEFCRREYIDEGFDANMLVITGNPYFDTFAKKAENFTASDRERIRREIGLPGDGLLLLLAGSVFMQEKERFGFWDLDIASIIIDALEDARSAGINVCLAIKLHPAMPADQKKVIEGIFFRTDNVVLEQSVGTQDLILAADATIVSVSTVGAEAVLMGKPCVSLQPGLKIKDNFFLSKHGVVPACYTHEDCRLLLKRLIADREYRENILPAKAAGFRTDGRATERVVNLICSMLR